MYEAYKFRIFTVFNVFLATEDVYSETYFEE